jgi:hypothetical protein
MGMIAETQTGMIIRPLPDGNKRSAKSIKTPVFAGLKNRSQ